MLGAAFSVDHQIGRDVGANGLHKNVDPRRGSAAADGRGETKYMLSAIVAEIIVLELAKHLAVVSQQSGLADVVASGPARRTVGVGIAVLAVAPDRHGNGDDDRDEAARGCDHPALVKDLRCVGIVGEPSPQQVIRSVDRMAEQREPRRAELSLQAECRCSPLGCCPDACKDYDENGQYLAP